MNWSLTYREKQVLELLDKGATTQEIADQLGITTHTIKNHLASAAQKLGTIGRGRTSTLAEARRLHLIRKG